MKTLKIICAVLLAGIVLGAAGFFLMGRYTTGTLSPNENPLTATEDTTVATNTNTASVANLPMTFT